MIPAKKNIANWNNYPVVPANEFSFDYSEELPFLLEPAKSMIARGNGRCYGDASLSENVISTLKYHHILFFDKENGIIECESGILFKDLIDFLIPGGWFLPVTPGTKFITLGGAVASDVHGKNHHKEGSFSEHILELKLMTADQEIFTVSKHQNTDLFFATVGGMGLSGLILSVKFRLKKIKTAYISQKQIRTKNLDEVIELFEEYKNFTYTMAWIDCLQQGHKQGRSVMFAGEHTKIEELTVSQQKRPLQIHSRKSLSVPFNLPAFVLNQSSVKLFNSMYYGMHRTKQNAIIDYDSFFFPLDSILHWNKMYGKSGFIQYQFVLPISDGSEGLKKILNKISEKGWGSFLAVLKLFGKQKSLISFPMEGLTLALDFPIRKGIFEFLNELDVIVIDHGGRIYLSKDARMNRETYLKTYQNAEEFQRIIKKYNPGTQFESYLSKRLGLLD
ncbi:FAD-binding oxidoreductase [Marivirga sp. S37H4]|uniref:FAD-binding oxidoreductase n=1 Tax=Marivirga aurantiaca TaxID=2802615 RepID=A0A935CB11_9BACT|nr:FAD-binding oxidoreductase [Marivirga aurantiaca]MBK6266517.1 FAD-binding oxidoreductase [Marivirga aurantiaca]